MRTLLAEDDATSHLLVEAALRKWGCDVISVNDGIAACKILQGDDPPELAVLDWMMPGLSGPEVRLPDPGVELG